jgi:DNA-binding response OmpR family regulator
MRWSRPGAWLESGVRNGVLAAVAAANGRSAPPTRRPERTAKVLIVAADAAVTTPIAHTLAEAGYEVAVASRATPVRDAILDGGACDLVVLDAGLPAAQGFAVLQTLRAWGVSTPVLLVTGGGDLGETIRGLDLGADDVAARRCPVDELKARVGALLRRGAADVGGARG